MSLFKKVKKLRDKSYIISRRIYEKTGFNIETFYKGDLFAKTKEDLDDAYFGVSWSSHGTVPVKEAEKFVKALKIAIKEAKKLNKELKILAK